MSSPRFLAGLAIATCVLIQAPSLSYELVWDDIDSLVQKNLGCEKALECFSVATSGAYYRPLFAASMAVGFALADSDPVRAETVMHLQNLVLFALELTCILFFFTTCFGALNAQAIGATLLFGAHPLQVSAVAWVTGRADVLPPLFAALALGLWLRASRAPSLNVKWLAAGLGAFGLALFCKEQVLPLVLLLPLVFRGRWRAMAATFVGAMALTVAWAIIRHWLLASAPPVDPRWSWVDHLSIVIRTVAHSLKSLALPLPSTLHRITAAPWGEFEVAEVALALGSVTFWVALGLRLRNHPSFVFWLWSSVTVLPVLNVVPLNLALGPYRLILPLVGVAGLLATVVRPKVVLVISAGLAALTAVDLPNWRSDAALSAAILEADPENMDWSLTAARELNDRHQLEPALELATNAVTTVFESAKTAPEFVSRAATADFRRRMGEHSTLRRQLFSAFHGAGALCFRSMLLHELGRIEEEVRDLEACTQISWSPQWRDKYVDGLLRLGRTFEALQALRGLNERAPTAERALRLQSLIEREVR